LTADAIPRREHIQKLLKNYNRRLQALQERQALYGLDTPVAILTEITDIEAQIETLQIELEQQQHDEALTAAPKPATREPQPAAETLPRRVSQDRLDEIFALTWSPDNQLLASSDSAGIIRVWETQGWQKRQIQGHPRSIFDLDFTLSGRTLISGGNDRMVNLWDPLTLRRHLRFDPTLTPVYGVSSSPDEQMVACGTIQGELIVWRVEDQRRVLQTRQARVVLGLSFSPDGRYLVAAFSRPDQLAIFDTKTFEPQAVIPVERKRSRERNTFLRKLRFNPSGTLLTTACFDGIVRVWDFYSHSLRTEFDDGLSYFCDVSFDPTGTQLACGCTTGDIGLWNISEERQIARLYGHKAYTKTVAYSRNGRLLASGSYDGTIRIWHADPLDPDFGQCQIIIGQGLQ
jgi:WD40 repeat protein